MALIYKKNQINRKKVWTVWPPEYNCPLSTANYCDTRLPGAITMDRQYSKHGHTWTPKLWPDYGQYGRKYGQWALCQPNVFLYGIFKRSKTSGTSGTSGTVEYRIHNLLPFIAIQSSCRRLELTDNILICPTSTKTSGTKSRTSGTAKWLIRINIPCWA